MLSFPTCFQYFIALLFIEYQPQVEKIVANQLQMMMTCWMSFCLVSPLGNVDSTPAPPSHSGASVLFSSKLKAHTFSSKQKDSLSQKILEPNHLFYGFVLSSEINGKKSLTDIYGNWTK